MGHKDYSHPSDSCRKPVSSAASIDNSDTHEHVRLTRPTVCGKFLFTGAQKLYVKGVTYGAFRPDNRGREYTNTEVIERDFAQMAANGINAVRIPHTCPPRSLLDIAQRHGLYVMVGLSAEQYVG